MLATATLTAVPSGPLHGELGVPGDKSISHRALILGALAQGETRVHGLLESLDVLATAEAVRAFGAELRRLGDGEWQVLGCDWRSPARAIDCGNSGTSARLLMGAAASFPIEATFTGDRSLRSRPMRRILDPLERMGAQTVSDAGKLPITICGGRLQGIRHASPVASAQVKSAVLLAGLHAEGEVEVTEPSPSRDHTERMLHDFGCQIEFGPGFARLGCERRLRGAQVHVPGDPSSAAFPMVASLVIPGSELLLPGVLLDPLRSGLLTTLQQMGGQIDITNPSDHAADVRLRHSWLHGIEVPASRFPSMVDEYPVLAIAAAFASGPTVMRGLSELRVKESDRLAAIIDGLGRCGVAARCHGDDLIVEGCGGNPPGGAQVRAQGDHRIAMAFLTLGLAARSPVTVDCAASIATSFPDFDKAMRSVGADVR